MISFMHFFSQQLCWYVNYSTRLKHLKRLSKSSRKPWYCLINYSSQSIKMINILLILFCFFSENMNEWRRILQGKHVIGLAFPLRISLRSNSPLSSIFYPHLGRWFYKSQPPARAMVTRKQVMALSKRWRWHWENLAWKGIHIPLQWTHTLLQFLETVLCRLVSSYPFAK
jgi:hypothetical protein